MKVLDEGYVELVETWGSDERIIESARMSTSKGFQGWGTPCTFCGGMGDHACKKICEDCKGTGIIAGDEKLLRFLYEHKHMTPFEMAGATFEIQAPIMVFREWHRHRTQSYNELSARYTELPNMFYLPSVERLMDAKQSKKNKQGSEAGFTRKEAEATRTALTEGYEVARAVYEGLLKKGVAREIARLVIPVSQYSKMRASANLRNWLGFLTLRTDPSAQWEIRQYAGAVQEVLLERFPRTMALWEEKIIRNG